MLGFVGSTLGLADIMFGLAESALNLVSLDPEVAGSTPSAAPLGALKMADEANFFWLIRIHVSQNLSRIKVHTEQAM